MKLRKTLSTIAALQQKTVPFGDVAQLFFKLPCLTREYQRWKPAERVFYSLERGLIAVLWQVTCGACAPGVGLPLISHEVRGGWRF